MPTVDENVYTFNIPAMYPDLSKTVRIDLFESNYGSGDVPFGRIWVFDLGEIKYSTQLGSSGEQNLLFQNGAILSIGMLGNQIKKDPFIYVTDDGISLRVVQFKGSKSITGKGDFNIKLIHSNSFSRDPYLIEEALKIKSFKLKYYGEETRSKIWFDFFEEKGFLKDPDFDTDSYVQNMLYYNEWDTDNYLVIDNSAFEVK